jgi:hypothetical protein
MSASIVTAFNKLKESKDYFLDAQRTYGGGKGSLLVAKYLTKIDWIYNDFITTPGLDKIVIDGIKEQWKSDVFVIDELQNKINLLQPDKRALIEVQIDALNAGETIEFEQKQ